MQSQSVNSSANYTFREVDPTPQTVPPHRNDFKGRHASHSQVGQPTHLISHFSRDRPWFRQRLKSIRNNQQLHKGTEYHHFLNSDYSSLPSLREQARPNCQHYWSVYRTICPVKLGINRLFV